MLEKIVPVVKRTLGERHAGVSMTMGNLACAYALSKEWENAEQMLVPLLETIPKTHPDCVKLMIGLSTVKTRTGRLEEAEGDCKMLLEKLGGQEHKVDSADRLIQSVVELLMDVYEAQGRLDGIKELKETYPVCFEDSGRVKVSWPSDIM
jgi:lipopolysaccharide biosynthesis regulator YciM